MKIPLKYGLLITLGVMAWVLIARNTVTNPSVARSHTRHANLHQPPPVRHDLSRSEGVGA